MRPFIFVLPVIAVALGLWACGDDDGTNPNATLLQGQFCDTSFPNDCPNRTCQDVVSGESCDNISCQDWDNPAIEGTICTRSCDVDADCTGIDFSSANGEQVTDETWVCDGVCKVLVTRPPSMGGGGLCDGCGGIFCAGRCIGCPQC